MTAILQKRTKIIATLGPATSDQATIAKLIAAGANTFRLNFSHGSPEDHQARAQAIRQAAAETGEYVSILGDLQGPKIRICGFQTGSIVLEDGAMFCLDCDLDKTAGDENQVGMLYKKLPEDCKVGDHLLLDDGRLTLEVTAIDGAKVHTKVIHGGKLSNNKGVNLSGGGLSAPALTEKDIADLKTAVDIDVDYLAISFPKSAQDMIDARRIATEAGFKGLLVAKIERAELVADEESLDDIIRASDAVMVARGDLGVEIGDAALVGVQKRIILRARQLNRVVITATQMMESMIDNPLPTRAEVFDVANAVLDGTDAVMLSAETATGAYPVKVVEAMTRVAAGAEKERTTQISQHRLNRIFDKPDETIAMAAMYAANHMDNMKAILCLTETGKTPLLMSRIRSGIPIFALSPNERTLRLSTLTRGVKPVHFEPANRNASDSIKEAMAHLVSQGYLSSGDTILCTVGDDIGQVGTTNTMKILIV